MSLALDSAALRELTGYKTGSRQAAWLRDQLRIDPPIGADGRPRITEEVVNQAMLARRPGGADTGKPPGQPNWTK